MKKISNNSTDYTAGDIIAWYLGKGQTHIGVLTQKKSKDNSRHMVVHNIGKGQELSDCLFSYKIIGHYFYE